MKKSLFLLTVLPVGIANNISAADYYRCTSASDCGGVDVSAANAKGFTVVPVCEAVRGISGNICTAGFNKSCESVFPKLKELGAQFSAANTFRDSRTGNCHVPLLKVAGAPQAAVSARAKATKDLFNAMLVDSSNNKNVKSNAEAAALVRAALDQGADVNARDERGINALHAAFIFDSHEIMQLLIDRGADVSAEGEATKYRVPVLWDIIGTQNKQLVQSLVNRGVDLLKIKDKDGMTMDALIKSGLSESGDSMSPEQKAYFNEILVLLEKTRR